MGRGGISMAAHRHLWRLGGVGGILWANMSLFIRAYWGFFRPSGIGIYRQYTIGHSE